MNAAQRSERGRGGRGGGDYPCEPGRVRFLYVFREMEDFLINLEIFYPDLFNPLIIGLTGDFAGYKDRNQVNGYGRGE